MSGVKSTRIIDPETYFAGWAYDIGPQFHVAMGVNPRYVIDREKTQPARDRAIAKGMPKAEATKRIKIMRREIVVNEPPTYRFHEGDTFYCRSTPSQRWVQVVAISYVNSKAMIEAHQEANGKRQAFLISPISMANLLQHGGFLSAADRIPPSASKAETLRLEIDQNYT